MNMVVFKHSILGFLPNRPNRTRNFPLDCPPKKKKGIKKMFNIILLFSLCVALVIDFMKRITAKEVSGFDVVLSCFIILSFCFLF